jgi:serine/threonine-protein kinase
VKGALLWSGIIWLIYLALEPFARKRWPVTLVSWGRLLSGNLRDPLIGRDLLIGVLAAVIMQLVYSSKNLFSN